jgi:hypothetical protein
MVEFWTSAPGFISAAGLAVLIFSQWLRRKPSAVQRAWDVRLIMQVLISLIVLAAALFVILSNKYGADAQKWASGMVGTIVGYWLRNSSTVVSVR